MEFSGKRCSFTHPEGHRATLSFTRSCVSTVSLFLVPTNSWGKCLALQLPKRSSMFHQLPANWVCVLFGAKQMVWRVLLELFRRKWPNENNEAKRHWARQFNDELNIIIKFCENRGELWIDNLCRFSATQCFLSQILSSYFIVNQWQLDMLCHQSVYFFFLTPTMTFPKPNQAVFT